MTISVGFLSAADKVKKKQCRGVVFCAYTASAVMQDRREILLMWMSFSTIGKDSLSHPLTQQHSGTRAHEVSYTSLLTHFARTSSLSKSPALETRDRSIHIVGPSLSPSCLANRSLSLSSSGERRDRISESVGRGAGEWAHAREDVDVVDRVR